MQWPYQRLLVLPILLFRIESCESQNNNDKKDFCSNLYCENERSSSACGIREEGEGFKLRLFENKCELMKYGCQVEDEKAYGIINPEYCKQLFMESNNIYKPEANVDDRESETVSPCVEFDCSYPTDAKEVCGIRQDGRGFKVRMFTNKCQLITHNCINKTNFTRTDLLFCNGVDVPEDTNSNVMKVRRRVYRRAPNVVVIDANMFNFNNNITEAVDNFFAATHVFDLPIDEMNKHVNETARRMLINIFGPQVVFKPWIYIPTNISEDAMHTPTLSSCFHKCPTVCPNTYAPVCGQPGLAAREPSLMFMNHCYMDAAQCKMRWEANSDTAESSSYIESTFMFCLGDSYNTVFRFLPLVRTLQHMGRLKKKGYFRYKMRNMRFLNNMLLREPNPQGR